jgi:hypothetical protein
LLFDNHSSSSTSSASSGGPTGRASLGWRSSRPNSRRSSPATSRRRRKLEALAKIWPRFRETLVNSPHLTRFDAGQIANDLQERLKAIDSENPFIETRAWGTDEVERPPATKLDFADVAETGKGDLEEGEQALERLPSSPDGRRTVRPCEGGSDRADQGCSPMSRARVYMMKIPFPRSGCARTRARVLGEGPRER